MFSVRENKSVPLINIERWKICINYNPVMATYEPIPIMHCSQKYSQRLPLSTGNRMHHTRTRTREATTLSQGGVRHHAGMLAAGTTAEVKHQRHPENSLCLGQSHTCLPGYPGLVGLRLSVCVYPKEERPGNNPKQYLTASLSDTYNMGMDLSACYFFRYTSIKVFKKHFYILFTCIENVQQRSLSLFLSLFLWFRKEGAYF